MTRKDTVDKPNQPNGCYTYSGYEDVYFNTDKGTITETRLPHGVHVQERSRTE